MAEVEAALAEGTPAAEDAWQYPPAPLGNDTPPAPGLSWGAWILLGTVVAVAVIAVVLASG